MSQKVIVIAESVLLKIIKDSRKRAREFSLQFAIGGEESVAESMGFHDGKAKLAEYLLREEGYPMDAGAALSRYKLKKRQK